MTVNIVYNYILDAYVKYIVDNAEFKKIFLSLKDGDKSK